MPLPSRFAAAGEPWPRLRAVTLRRATLLVVLLAIAGCRGRPSFSQDATAEPREVSIVRPHVALLDLRNGLPERSNSGLLSEVTPTSFSHLLLRLDALKHNSRVRGVLVRLGTASTSLARAEEMGRQLRAIASAPSPPRIVCHGNAYDNRTLWLAAVGCDELWLSPSGMVSSVGIAAQLMFGRQLLDDLSVGVDFLQVGRFKGASEPFTRNEASPEARSSLAQTLRALRHAWITGIEKRRGKDAAALGLEDGPHTAEKAKALGLIDRVGYFADARLALLQHSQAEGYSSYFGGAPPSSPDIDDVLRRLSGAQAIHGPHIALVRAVGAITMQSSRSLLGAQSGIDEQSLSRKLRELTRDAHAQAVVLRIDSPGGSALASDLLWRSIMDLRKVKPVVISVGGMAASGGYYLAAAGHHIFAERSSIIGSIGVVAGKFTFVKSLERLGIHVETVSPAGDGGARALHASALMPWDDATRAKMKESIESTYDLFLSRIAEGRSMSVEAIAPAAEGRIMGGIAAAEAGLIDAIGGLDDAIAKARELAQAGPDVPVEIVDQPASLLDVLSRGEQARSPASVARRIPILKHETAAFLASVAPLLENETILTTLPFALVLR